MAGQLDPIWVPTPTTTTPTRGTKIAEFPARAFGCRPSCCLDLWQCSAPRLDSCDAVGTFLGVQSPSPHRATRAGIVPHVRSFHGAQVSYIVPLFAGCAVDS